MEITIIPMLEDNYSYLLIGDNGETVLIDPAEAEPAIAVLTARRLGLDFIVNTHHHHDHTGGNAALKAKYGCRVIGPGKEADSIPAIDRTMSDGDRLSLCGVDFHILETPGHTKGHICLYDPRAGVLFSGDTLFSLSCGRLFEGTPAQMWDSFQKLTALPDETRIYCGHEYTIENGEFGLTIEPDNDDLQDYLAQARALRARNMPTVPSTLKTEKAANVMLRAGSAARFAEIRRLKDNW